MERIQRRAGLIGVGAVVVVAVAIGVAVANSGSSHHQRPFLKFADRYLGRSIGPGPLGGPLGGGPMQRRLPVAPPMRRGGGPLGSGPNFARPLAGHLLHGEGTVVGPNGKYQTVDVQRGTVRKVSPGSVTVRSADGFIKTYAATGSLLRAVAKGDLVQLRATVTGSKATVVSLADLTRMTRSSTNGDFPPQQG